MTWPQWAFLALIICILLASIVDRVMAAGTEPGQVRQADGLCRTEPAALALATAPPGSPAIGTILATGECVMPPSGRLFSVVLVAAGDTVDDGQHRWRLWSVLVIPSGRPAWAMELLGPVAGY